MKLHPDNGITPSGGLYSSPGPQGLSNKTSCKLITAPQPRLHVLGVSFYVPVVTPQPYDKELKRVKNK